MTSPASNQSDLSIHKYRNEEKVPPTKEDEELELIIKAREIFCTKLYKDSSNYEDDPAPLSQKCRELLSKDIERIKNLPNISDAAYLIFDRYKEEAVTSTLPIFLEKYPNATHLEGAIRSDLDSAARILHSLVIRKPIVEVLKEAFPDRADELSKAKIDLRKKIEI